MNQQRTPLADALAATAARSTIPFDVPGHKGRLSALADYFGERCLSLDKNSRPELDNLCRPTRVIREAEALAAEAFGAAQAYFMVGGTTSAVQAMILGACAPGEKIILPRNVHSSVIHAIILAGAMPVYLHPRVQERTGIFLGVDRSDLEACIRENPDARAVFVNNPTYYGICSDMDAIVALAHRHGMAVLADEAHGTHFYFGEDLPRAAMHAGADMAAVSLHKTGGSLTQSSILLVGERFSREHITSVIELSRTTSASYLLLSSLDLARRYLATEGRAALSETLRLARATRARINALGGYHAFGAELIDGRSVCGFDDTKLAVNTRDIGRSGIEVYDILRREYGIQLEFGDIGHILALATLADTAEDHDRLVEALADLKRRYGRAEPLCPACESVEPTLALSPREAFYAPKEECPLALCEGRVAGGTVTCYPPGIPLLLPGELVTREVLARIRCAVDTGCQVIGLTEAGGLSVLR